MKYLKYCPVDDNRRNVAPERAKGDYLNYSSVGLLWILTVGLI